MRLFRSLGPLVRASISLKLHQARPPFPVRSFSIGSPVFDVETSDEFNEKVVNSSIPVIVDFHAEWCGPCQVLGPRLQEKIIGRGGQVLLAKVNVDYAGEVATDYQVAVVPTVISFKNGEMISSFQGVLDDEELDLFIDEAIND